MNKSLTINLPEAVFNRLEDVAGTLGVTLSEWAAAHLNRGLVAPETADSSTANAGGQAGGQSPPLARPPKAPLEELLRFSGAAASADPDSGNNERIDADLACAYTATHQPEA